MQVKKTDDCPDQNSTPNIHKRHNRVSTDTLTSGVGTKQVLRDLAKWNNDLIPRKSYFSYPSSQLPVCSKKGPLFLKSGSSDLKVQHIYLIKGFYQSLNILLIFISIYHASANLKMGEQKMLSSWVGIHNSGSTQELHLQLPFYILFCSNPKKIS